VKFDIVYMQMIKYWPHLWHVCVMYL